MIVIRLWLIQISQYKNEFDRVVPSRLSSLSSMNKIAAGLLLSSSDSLPMRIFSRLLENSELRVSKLVEPRLLRSG
jgi:hypothetical protein